MPASAMGAQQGIFSGQSFEAGSPALIIGGFAYHLFGDVEQIAAESNIFSAMTICQESVISDSHELVG